MGLCISVASSEIHDIEYGDESVVYVQDNIIINQDSKEIPRRQIIGSLYSEQGSKGLNQDAGMIYQGYGEEDLVFGGVYDGHGPNGHIVSKLVRNRLPTLLLNQQYGNKVKGEFVPNKHVFKSKETFISAFKMMDKEIKLMKNLDSTCSGTTAVVAIRQGEELVIANLGDSRAVLGTMTDNKITAIPLTTDQKPDLALEAERIRRCHGRVLALMDEPHIQRVWLPHHNSPGLAMSRAFGNFHLKNHGIIAVPDVQVHALTSDHQFLVLATDGVWDVLSNDDVVSIVSKEDSEESASKAVVDAAISAWSEKFRSSKRDDCSVVCLFLQNKQKQDEKLQI